MAKPISAGLARRLAEAADGHRDDAEHYFVYRYDEHDDRDAEFPTAAAAQAYHRDVLHGSGDFAVFGPYRTSEMTTSRLKIEKIAVRVGTEDLEIDPRAVDSMFWTPSAYDKFLIPYYTRVLGMKKAAELRERMLTWQFVMHPPGSYPIGEPSVDEKGMPAEFVPLHILEKIIADPARLMIGMGVDGIFEEVLLAAEGKLSYRIAGR